MPKRDFSQAFAPADVRPDMSSGIADMISAATALQQRDGDQRWWLPVALIHPDPDQPRGGMDTQQELQALADSLRGEDPTETTFARGQLQPVMVRLDPMHPGDEVRPAEWIIVAGERRWRAARKGGLEHVWAAQAGDEILVNDVALLKAQIVENEQRTDLSDIDIALAAERLHEAGCPITEINSLLRYSNRRTLEQKRKVARELHPEVRHMLRQGTLPGTHGRTLIRVPKEDQVAFARFAAEHNLGSRDLVAVIDGLHGESPTDELLTDVYESILADRREQKRIVAARLPVFTREVDGVTVTRIVPSALRSVQLAKRPNATPNEAILALEADLELLRSYCPNG